MARSSAVSPTPEPPAPRPLVTFYVNVDRDSLSRRLTLDAFGEMMKAVGGSCTRDSWLVILKAPRGPDADPRARLDSVKVFLGAIRNAMPSAVFSAAKGKQIAEEAVRRAEEAGETGRMDSALTRWFLDDGGFTYVIGREAE